MKERTGVFVRRLSLGLLAAAITALLLASAAPASAGTLDQQQTTSSTDSGVRENDALAQTFTAGITGGLDQVDLLLLKVGTPPSYTVEIRNTSAGNPGTSVLATASLPLSALVTDPSGSFIPVTFAPPAPVAAGTQYAIVIYGPAVGSNLIGWRYQNTNPYPAGAMFQSLDPDPPGGSWMFNGVGTEDAGFKTYVAPPPVTPVTPTTPATPTTNKKKKCKKKKHKRSAESAKKKKCKKKKKK